MFISVCPGNLYLRPLFLLYVYNMLFDETLQTGPKYILTLSIPNVAVEMDG